MGNVQSFKSYCVSYIIAKMGDDGVAHVEPDLQWLRYVQATTVNHTFTEDWGRRMEEILIPVGTLKMEEPSSEEQRQKGDGGEKRMLKVRKPKEPIETSPRNQQKPSSQPAHKSRPMSDKKSRSSLPD